MKFEVLVCTWAPIGNHGFKYYWDPEWIDPLTGCHEIHYMNASAGYAVKLSLNPDYAVSNSYLEWIIPNHFVKVEEGWLRNRDNNVHMGL